MRHGRHAQHNREHHVRDDHHDLPVTFGELRGVVANLRQRREGDVLHRLDARRSGHILELHRLVERSERRRRIEFPEEKLGYLVVEIRNQIRHHQTAPERRHLPQGFQTAFTAGPPVAEPPQQRSPHPDRDHALRHEAPDAPPRQRQRNGREAARERRSEGHLRQQREAKLPDKNRILNSRQGAERQQQKENRGDLCNLGHPVPARRPGRHRHQQRIEHHRNGHIEKENRLVIALRRALMANQALRETAVDDHQQHRHDRRRNGHEAQDVACQQAQNDQPHGHCEEHRADLLGHAPRHALRDFLFELAPQTLTVMLRGDLLVALADVAHVGDLDIRSAAVGTETAAHDGH